MSRGFVSVVADWAGTESLAEAAEHAASASTGKVEDFVGRYGAYSSSWTHEQGARTPALYLPALGPTPRLPSFRYDAPERGVTMTGGQLGFGDAIREPARIPGVVDSVKHLLLYSERVAIGNLLSARYDHPSGWVPEWPLERQVVASWLRVLAPLQPLLEEGHLVLCEHPWRREATRTSNPLPDDDAESLAQAVYYHSQQATGAVDDPLLREVLMQAAFEHALSRTLAERTGAYLPWLPAPSPLLGEPVDLRAWVRDVSATTDAAWDLMLVEALEDAGLDDGVAADLGTDDDTASDHAAVRDQTRRLLALTELPDLSGLSIEEIVALRRDSAEFAAWRASLAAAIDTAALSTLPGSPDGDLATQVGLLLGEGSQRLRERLDRAAPRMWRDVVRPTGQDLVVEASSPFSLGAAALLGDRLGQALLAAGAAGLLHAVWRLARQVSVYADADPAVSAPVRAHLAHVSVLAPRPRTG